MNTQSDNQIIQLLCDRDESALRILQHKYGKLCSSVSLGILANQQDAEECCNDALMKIWNSIPPKRPENLSAYVVTIVKHLSIDRYKAGKAKCRCDSQLPLAIDELENTVVGKENVESIVDQHQLVLAMETFVRSLPREHGRIFLLRYHEYLSVHEIAKTCGISVTNVKVILLRTRKQLRKHLSQEGML